MHTELTGFSLPSHKDESLMIDHWLGKTQISILICTITSVEGFQDRALLNACVFLKIYGGTTNGEDHQKEDLKL